MRRQRPLQYCVIILAFLLPACLVSRADQKDARRRAALAKQIITENQCGKCHALQAKSLNLTGTVGPDLTSQSQRGRSSQWLRQQLTHPRSIPDAEVVPGFEGKQKFMPSFKHLSDAELDALIEFLQTLP